MATHEISTASDLEDLRIKILNAQNNGLEVAAMTLTPENEYLIVFKRSSVEIHHDRF